VSASVFLPQQQQGHTLALELVIDRGEVRQRIGRPRAATALALEAAFELIIIPIRRQRLIQAQLTGAAGVFGDHALG
jgi:hypothetical protein